MKKIVIGSVRPNAGKTSLVLGVGGHPDRRIGYLKPLGDRPVYKKKRLWDTDVSLMTRVLDLHESPEIMTLGFDHSKLRFKYDQRELTRHLNEMVDAAGAEKDAVILEAGSELSSGASLGLDPFSLATRVEAECFIVVSGTAEEVVDQACFLASLTRFPDSRFGGVVFNRVADPDEFRKEFLPLVEESGVRVAGILADAPVVRSLTIPYLEENLFLKPLVNQKPSGGEVACVFLGAMSVSEARKQPAFQSRSKLVITSGDHSDLVLAAIESGSAGILLADGISPGADITARAGEKRIPLFLSACDLYELARQVERLTPLPGPDDRVRMRTLRDLVAKGVDFGF